jgi:hypothetical protein
MRYLNKILLPQQVIANPSNGKWNLDISDMI